MVFAFSGFTTKMNLLKHEQFPVDIGSKQLCINVGASRESSPPLQPWGEFCFCHEQRLAWGSMKASKSGPQLGWWFREWGTVFGLSYHLVSPWAVLRGQLSRYCLNGWLSSLWVWLGEAGGGGHALFLICHAGNSLGLVPFPWEIQLSRPGHGSWFLSVLAKSLNSQVSHIYESSPLVNFLSQVSWVNVLVVKTLRLTAS